MYRDVGGKLVHSRFVPGSCSMRCELHIYTTQIHNSTITQQFNTMVIIIIQNDNERMAALTYLGVTTTYACP